MSSISDTGGKVSAKLIYNLTCKLTGKDGDNVTSCFKLALHIAQSIGTSYPNESKEKEVLEDIKRSLSRDKKEKEAVRLCQLYCKLLSNTVIKDRWAILRFLFNLKDSNASSTNAKLGILVKNVLSDVTVRNTRMPLLETDKNDKDHNYESIRNFWQESSRSRNKNKTAKLTNGQKISESRGCSESSILRAMLYAFQAISSEILKFDCQKEEFWIDPKVDISTPVRQQMLKLAELGWLYNRVNKYYTSACNRRSGLVEQSFAAALRNELNEYYRLLAVLESQLQVEDEQGINSNSGLTISGLSYWALDSLQRFKTLASLVDTCKGLKGGALASAIYSYSVHGDPLIRNLVKNIWSVASVPIYRILTRWITDGELDDIFEEFFVAAVPGVSKDHLWDEKYRLKESMVPSFLTIDQALKILSIGKSINFLRHVCQDKAPHQERIRISKIISQSSDFTLNLDCNLQKIIDVTYKETSNRLLNVMHSTYKFMEHLKAMRRYLLLGQGDFIRHLMDLLEPHLNQTASTLYMQNLSGILDTAIRSTNAQFDDIEILKRLDNRLMEVSLGDCGWDIYTLDYKIDGPIATVFTPKVMKFYLQLFHYLWKAKRMEYSLSDMWQSQMAFSKTFKIIPELCSVMHHCHILTSEMVHFIQQMQYYITFEVMECSWDVLETKVKAAEDLDSIIIAHNEFLETVMTRVLLDDSSEDLRMQLQTIYNLIIQFKTLQDTFFDLAKKELQLRNDRMEDIRKNLNSDVDQLLIQAEKSRQAEFLMNVSPTKSQLRILSTAYQDMVKKFLLKLTSHRDVNLRFLSFRLDFNSHYKKQDARLHTSLTFQKRRQISKVRLVNK